MEHGAPAVPPRPTQHLATPPPLPCGPQSNMTPFAKQCLSEMQPKYLIELFQEGELLVSARCAVCAVLC